MKDIEQRIKDIKFDWTEKQRTYQFRPLTLEVVDVDWLIEQVEQMQRLEERNRILEQLRLAQVQQKELAHDKVEEYEQQNKRYREALEYYAAPITWVPDETGVSDADKHTNTIAREALEIDS